MKASKMMHSIETPRGAINTGCCGEDKECRSVGGGWPICCCSEAGAKDTSTTRSAKFSSPHGPKTPLFPPQTNPLCTPWQ